MTAVHALYEQHILKTGRGDKDHPRALTLKKRVDPQGGAQHNRGGVFDLETGLANNADQGFDGILGGGKFADDEITGGIVHSDQIGKSSTGIDTASDPWANCKPS